MKTLFRPSFFRIRIYEVPFLFIIIVIIFVSVWRCYYYPPTPSDITTGAEAVAEYTVREHTMVNSVFSVTQNGNSLKPPFITSLQIIYKYAGFPFGQVWLSSIVICLVIFLYHALNRTLHRLVAGLLIVMMMAVPEMYAYTFMILYDYSNAVFFFLAVCFVIVYFKWHRLNDLAFAGLLIGIATYLRPETLLLCFGMLLPIFFNAWKTKMEIKRILIAITLFVLPTVLIYVSSVYIYIHYYLPGGYTIAAQINPAIGNIKAAFAQIREATMSLIFNEQGIIYYGYFIFIFLGVLAAELFYIRRWNRVAKNCLFAILMVYIFYPLLSHALPGVSINYTVKRAYLKLFPLMVLYMANSTILMSLSNYISRWELKKTV